MLEKRLQKKNLKLSSQHSGDTAMSRFEMEVTSFSTAHAVGICVVLPMITREGPCILW